MTEVPSATCLSAPLPHAPWSIASTDWPGTALEVVGQAPVDASSVVSVGLGVLITAVLSGAVLAAFVTASINILLARRKSREEERNRLRASFAEAFAACTAYQEFPYAIRRRRADTLGEERIRLSESIREIQTNIAYHLAWTDMESEQVGRAYGELVGHVRRIAGVAMHEAWNAPATDSDSAMNIPPALVDLAELRPYETAYIEAVRAHLYQLAPWWAR